jgi:hypothetical protein
LCRPSRAAVVLGGLFEATGDRIDVVSLRQRAGSAR